MIQRANAQATAASAHADSNRTLDVLVIGTGFSGVCVGIKLLEKGISNFRIYEKSQGIGGTWYDNTYPGAACDVPSHFYCYSFEPNPNWSRIYSPRAEIQSYIEGCVDKYGLRPYIVHSATVVEIRLDEQAGLWRVTFADGNRVFARHVSNGSGGLHKPSIPDFPGRDTFSGAAMHTARWDHTVDLSNKRVAVIGSAASAIQVIPEVARIATAVSVFQRTPNYIAPRGDRPYTDSEKQRFARWPWLLRLYRWFIYKRLDILLFPITKKTSVVYMVEQMVQFIIRMIEAAGENSLITVKRSAQEAYNARLQAALDDSVWASGCNSWYITDSGKITTLYPNNAAAFKRELAGVSLQDFEFIDAERANQAA